MYCCVRVLKIKWISFYKKSFSVIYFFRYADDMFSRLILFTVDIIILLLFRTCMLFHKFLQYRNIQAFVYKWFVRLTNSQNDRKIKDKHVSSKRFASFHPPLLAFKWIAIFLLTFYLLLRTKPQHHHIAL